MELLDSKYSLCCGPFVIKKKIEETIWQTKIKKEQRLDILLTSNFFLCLYMQTKGKRKKEIEHKYLRGK